MWLQEMLETVRKSLQYWLMVSTQEKGDRHLSQDGTQSGSYGRIETAIPSVSDPDTMQTTHL